MSLPIASSGAASALPAVNIPPHGHGHKGSDSAAQIPAGTGQNLFGGLLTSLEQVIGAQSTTGTAGTAANSASGTTQTKAATEAQSVGAAAKSLLGTVGSAISLFA